MNLHVGMTHPFHFWNNINMLYIPWTELHNIGWGRQWCYTPLIPALRRQKQADCEFKASLVFRASSRTGSKSTQRTPVSKKKKKISCHLLLLILDRLKNHQLKTIQYLDSNTKSKVIVVSEALLHAQYLSPANDLLYWWWWVFSFTNPKFNINNPVRFFIRLRMLKPI